MEFQPRDLVTIIGGAISLTGLYYALKRDVVRVSTALGKVESYHKREIEMINVALKEQKTELNAKNDKLEGKIDAIQTQIAMISSHLAELNGYLKAK
jgi:ABC-type phosphate transport system auxiliary subunit